MTEYKYLASDDEHKINDKVFDNFADAFDYCQNGLKTFIHEVAFEDGEEVEDSEEVVWTWDDTHSREEAIALVSARHGEAAPEKAEEMPCEKGECCKSDEITAKLIQALKHAAADFRTLHRNLVGGNWFFIHQLLEDYYNSMDHFEDLIIENLMSLGFCDVELDCEGMLEAKPYSEEEAMTIVKEKLAEIKAISSELRNTIELPTAVAPAFDELEQWLEIEGDYKLMNYFKEKPEDRLSKAEVDNPFEVTWEEEASAEKDVQVDEACKKRDHDKLEKALGEAMTDLDDLDLEEEMVSDCEEDEDCEPVLEDISKEEVKGLVNKWMEDPQAADPQADLDKLARAELTEGIGDWLAKTFTHLTNPDNVFEEFCVCKWVAEGESDGKWKTSAGMTFKTSGEAIKKAKEVASKDSDDSHAYLVYGQAISAPKLVKALDLRAVALKQGKATNVIAQDAIKNIQDALKLGDATTNLYRLYWVVSSGNGKVESGQKGDALTAKANPVMPFEGNFKAEGDQQGLDKYVETMKALDKHKDDVSSAKPATTAEDAFDDEVSF